MNTYKIISQVVVASLVSIATSGFAITEDDSVHSWGPWTTLVQPAAGRTAPVSTTVAGPVTPGFGAGDTNQFTPVVTTPSTTPTTPSSGDSCVAGSACNYALIYSRGDGETSLQAATVTLNPIPVRQQVSEQQPPGDGPVAIQVAPAFETSLNINSTSSLPLSISVNNVLVNFINSTLWRYNAGRDFVQGNTVDAGGSAFVYGLSEISEADRTRTIGYFIAGSLTGTDELDAFNVGEVEASYEGFTLNSGVEVAIDVDFGAGTWNGSWNDGNDGGVRAVMSTDGVNVLKGAVGFNAEGVIDGANLVSTSISASDATSISGTIDGSFFGGGASVLAGSLEIKKSTQNYTDGEYQDLYVTSRNVTLPQARPE